MTINNKKQRSVSVGLIEVWTMVAVILHCCDVSAFGEWPVIAWPWSWSCFCLFIWEWIIVAVLFVVFTLLESKSK